MHLPVQLLEVIQDPRVRDVVISGNYCALDYGLGLEEAPNPFSEAELEGEIRQLAFDAGQRCDIAKPAADVAFDRFRLHLVLPYGISAKAQLSLRVHPKTHLTLDDIVESGGLSATSASWLKAAAAEHKTIVFSGATGSGKTTLL